MLSTTSRTASTSTAKPRGSAATPIAVRACGAALAEHRGEQVGRPVDDPGLVGELGRAGDEAAHLHDLGDGVERAERVAGLGEQVERARPGRRVALDRR